MYALSDDEHVFDTVMPPARSFNPLEVAAEWRRPEGKDSPTWDAPGVPDRREMVVSRR
jgi:hypothetical protein